MTAATATRKTARKTRKPMSEAKKAQVLAERKERTEKLQATIAAQVETLASSEQWAKYLEFSGSFHQYSLSNLMLIWAQCPTATRVAGFKQWQERGRQVISKEEGARAITIRGFATKRYSDTDDETGEKVEGKFVYFPARTVFDIADTIPITEDMLERIKSGPRGNPKAKVWTGDHNPVRLLEGEDEHGIESRIAEYVTGLGWTYELETITDGSNGYTTLDGSKRIAVRDDIDAAQRAKTATHEAAHLLMHTDPATGLRAGDAPEDRAVRELEAESVAYIVAGALGMATEGYSIGYLTGWAKGNGEAVRATAERVLKTANQILEEAFPVLDEPEADDQTED